MPAALECNYDYIMFTLTTVFPAAYIQTTHERIHSSDVITTVNISCEGRSKSIATRYIILKILHNLYISKSAFFTYPVMPSYPCSYFRTQPN